MADESIYSLIPQPVAMPTKTNRHISKHDPSTQPTYSTFGITGTSKPAYTNLAGNSALQTEGHHTYKKTVATMGKDGNAIPPSSVLKKTTGGGGGAGDALGKTAGSFTYTDKLRPAVPSKDECRQAADALKKGETKNFIQSNAVANILAKPPAVTPETDWTQKPHFGKVPPYLKKIQKEIHEEYEYIRSMQEGPGADAAPEGMRLLPEGERLALIDDLKRKWDAVNATYQQSSVLSLASLDTIGKVKRKEMYEAQLAQIEKDVEKLSKKFVYVRDDGDD